MLVLLTLALTSGSRVFEYEYNSERNFSNPSKTFKAKEVQSDSLIGYNTLDGELMELIESSYEEQGTINCAILGSGIGGSGDPRRKWEEMGEREREREGVLKNVAFVCKMI